MWKEYNMQFQNASDTYGFSIPGPDTSRITNAVQVHSNTHYHNSFNILPGL